MLPVRVSRVQESEDFTTVVGVELALENGQGAITTIVPAPENEDYAAEKNAAGGLDALGPLPMGQGRADHPRVAYTSALMVVGAVPGNAAPLSYRWKRWMRSRSWYITQDAAGTKWIVTQRGKIGFPDPHDDTGDSAYNDPTPSTTMNIYIYDNPTFPLDAVPADVQYVRSEKAWVYTVEAKIGGWWIAVGTLDVGNVIVAKRVGNSGVVNQDWQGIEHSNEVRVLDAAISEAEARTVVGGTLPIDLTAANQ
jgi:hypothetical protein